MRRSQEQSSGDHSTNLQAHHDIVMHAGVSVQEARNIALDVFKSNFLTLSGVAEEVARDRADRITREYLEQLQQRNPAALDSVRDPDMLQAIFNAQKGYACSGDEDLEQVLIDLLVDRSGQKERNIAALVLNEAIATLPKLTVHQCRIISLCFFIGHTDYTGQFDLPSFYSYIDSRLGGFSDIQLSNPYDFHHMQSTGVGSLDRYQDSLEGVFWKNYPGFFTKGFSEFMIPQPIRGPMTFVPCLRNRKRLQVNAGTRGQVTVLARSKGISKSVLQDLAYQGMMNGSKIKADLVLNVPAIGPLFDRWNSSDVQSFKLTTIGMAIGHSYLRSTGAVPTPLEFVDISLRDDLS